MDWNGRECVGRVDGERMGTTSRVHAVREKSLGKFERNGKRVESGEVALEMHEETMGK